MEKEHFKHYLVIFADRQKAKYFLWYDDTFEDEGEEIIDEYVHQRSRVNNGRPGKFDHHILDQLHRHMQHVGECALAYVEKQHMHPDGVIIGGHDETRWIIKKYLPHELKKRIIGDFVAQSHMSTLELIEKAKHIVNE